MHDFSRDSIVNVILNGIKSDIRLLLDHDRLRGALLLTLAGIDAMAFLAMPFGQTNATRADFTDWADRYIRFPCKAQLTGLDLYGARCAALPVYGTESELYRTARCKQIGWTSAMVPEIRHSPDKHPSVVMASIPALVEAFFTGGNVFLVDAYRDPERAALVDRRLATLMHALPGPINEKPG